MPATLVLLVGQRGDGNPVDGNLLMPQWIADPEMGELVLVEVKWRMVVGCAVRFSFARVPLGRLTSGCDPAAAKEQSKANSVRKPESS